MSHTPDNPKRERFIPPRDQLAKKAAQKVSKIVRRCARCGTTEGDGFTVWLCAFCRRKDPTVKPLEETPELSKYPGALRLEFDRVAVALLEAGVDPIDRATSIAHGYALDHA